MENNKLNWIANFIWGIADDVLRDLYVRGKYRDVIQNRLKRLRKRLTMEWTIPSRRLPMPGKAKTNSPKDIRKPDDSVQIGSPTGEIVLYSAPDGTVELNVRLERETVWLTQKQMSVLFDTERSVITKHLNNIFASGELEQEATVAKNATVQREGGREVIREIEYYNLDAVLSVGYRVNSKRGTQFRIWATRVLRDHLLKGYSVNERRLRDLNQAVRLIAGVVDRRDLSGDEARQLRYSRDETLLSSWTR
jgi:hypothetical protein